MESGRVQAVLSNTVVQSDQEEHLISLRKSTAVKLGNNITVRQSPAYSSQSQGSVERFHRTIMGHVRTLKAQLEANHDTSITSQHPVLPWLVRHAVYLPNRYATHAQTTQAPTEDGTKNIEHHYVSLEKQYFTNYHM